MDESWRGRQIRLAQWCSRPMCVGGVGGGRGRGWGKEGPWEFFRVALDKAINQRVHFSPFVERGQVSQLCLH